MVFISNTNSALVIAPFSTFTPPLVTFTVPLCFPAGLLPTHSTTEVGFTE